MIESPSPQPGDEGQQAAARTFACHAARLLADSHCEQTLVLDVRGISQVTDFLVITTGTSDRQIRSLGQDLKDLGRLEDHQPLSLHGTDTGQWVVVDFADVVVHLFEAEVRTYYDLESLWADGKTVDWEAVTEPGQFARLAAQRSAQKEDRS
ncbi:MAG: ribosome silencing factor [Phycisphaeraceae bacterium]